MKMITKACCCITFALLLSTSGTEAATAERNLTVTLSGFFQDQSPSGDEAAFPFRITTKDILEEITLATGTNVNGGVLLLIESLDSENGESRIIARSQTTEVGVTDFFEINQGSDVRTTKFAGNVFKSAIFYAIDQFTFSTLAENGLELKVQGFTKETQSAGLKKIGADKINVVSASTKSDGSGELQSADGFIGPVKGSIALSAPKFFP